MALLWPTLLRRAACGVRAACTGVAVGVSRSQAFAGVVAGVCVRMALPGLGVVATVGGGLHFISSLHAQTGFPPQNAVFSQPHADNANPYDAPVPGFIGPDGEGKANLFDFGDRDDTGPLEGYGVNNYVNPIFLGWAASVIAYQPAPAVDENWMYSGEMLGPVTGDNFSVVSLGDLSRKQLNAGLQPGYITVRFARRIYDAPGADIVVFENGFISENSTGEGSVSGEMFAELAYLEVSSNGTDFARFPSISRTAAPVGNYGTIDASNVYNLVGKHSNAYGLSWGTPFDLSDLQDDAEVISGRVDLNNIRFLRIVDIPGSGDFTDSRGHPIYDAWVTWGSGGADIEAAGAVSQPHSYADWLAKQNTLRPHGLRSPEQSQLIGYPELDEDGDGLSNALEYIMAYDPRLPDGRTPLRLRYDAQQNAAYLSFNRDVRVADYRLILERADGAQFPPVWRMALILGPLNEIDRVDRAIGAVDSESLSPQASIGVLRRYTVRIDDFVGASPATSRTMFRLRAEPVPVTE